MSDSAAIRFHRRQAFCGYGAAITGFLALMSSGQVPVPLMVYGFAALFLTPFRHRLGWQPTDRFWVKSTWFMFGVSVGLWRFFTRDPFTPIVLFTLHLLVMRLHTAQRHRDLLQIYAIAFGLLVLGAALSTSLWFFPLCVVHVFFLLSGMLLLSVRQQAQQVGALENEGGAIHLHWGGRVRSGMERIVAPKFRRAQLLVFLGLLTLATTFFLLLPRYEGQNWLSDLRQPPRSGEGVPMASGSGESSVGLGDISEIRLDHSIVMRVGFPDIDTTNGPPMTSMRLRTQALTNFDGERWQSRDWGVRLMHGLEAPVFLNEGEGDLLQEITIDRGASALLPGQTDIISGVVRSQRRFLIHHNIFEDWIQIGTQSRLADPMSCRVLSQVAPMDPHPTLADRSLTVYPTIDWNTIYTDDDARLQVERFYVNLSDWMERLQPNTRLNAPLADLRAIRSLATRWASDANAADPIAIANTLASRLRTDFEYTLTPPEPTTPDYPIRGFLEETRAGHCEYFATSMVVLLRSLGIPSRLATGYLTPEWNSAGEFFVVRESHAHAWVEVYAFDQGRWLTYDPTPPAGFPQDAKLGLLSDLQHWFDANRFTWYKWVIDLDQTSQKRLYSRLGMDEWRSEITGFMQGLGNQIRLASSRRAHFVPMVLAITILPLALLVTLSILWKRRKRERLKVNSQGTVYYKQMLRWLARRGHRRQPCQTPGEFAAVVLTTHPQWVAVREITEIHCRDRFGKDPLPTDLRQRAESLLQELRATSA